MTARGDPPITLFHNDEGAFLRPKISCTREQWSLGDDSELDGYEVTCPLHLTSFDIRRGRAFCLPARMSLATYDVEVDGEGTYFIEPTREAAVR